MTKKINFLVLIAILMVVGCAGELQKSKRLFMGTYFEIEIPRLKDSSQIIDKAYLRIKELDSKMNFYSDESELSKINSSAYLKPIPISEDMFRVLKRSAEVYGLSDKAFDITVGPLISLWGFGRVKNFNIPAKEELQKAIVLIGTDNMALDNVNHTVFLKKKGVNIDLGGIAKGYAIDEAVKVLKKYGIKSGVVRGGGEMHLIGAKPDGKPWSIGIRDPQEGYKIAAKMGLKDISVATSGDYENYFIKDNVRYSHIVDPRTGRAISGEPMGVTVLTKNSTDCDAFATAARVLGVEEGIEFIERQKDAACLFIFEKGGKTVIKKSKDFDRMCESYEEVK